MSYKTLIALASSLWLISVCDSSMSSKYNPLISVSYNKIIPLPVEVEQTSGYFVLDKMEEILISDKTISDVQYMIFSRLLSLS